MVRKLLFLICLLAIVSCNSNDSQNPDTVWIGGEIINPKTDFVVISKDHCIMDTVKLDRNNFFLYESKDMPTGLYSFQHYEYQIFFVEPGDSLMLRVNTVDFDESLSYTGKGAENNNFLMELFLLNEIEEKTFMPRIYYAPPEVFEEKLDSLAEVRRKIYDEFVSNNKPSKEFKKIVQASIDYNFYLKKELYVSANELRRGSGESYDIPKEFYAFREKVDYGNEQLRSYYPYYRFLRYHFDNLAYQQYKGTEEFGRSSYHHNYHKIKAIDSLVTCDSLKNSLLRTATVRYLLYSRDMENDRQIISLFEKGNTNKAHHKEISKLSAATAKLKPGNLIPNVFLLSTDNTVKDLRSVINRPTVLYFWSSQSIKHYKDIHSKASELKAKYPEYDFIGINTDTHFKKWLHTVKNSGYSHQHEFQFEDIEKAEKVLVINSMNKSIILDEKGVILESNTNLFSKSLEKMLLGYLN